MLSHEEFSLLNTAQSIINLEATKLLKVPRELSLLYNDSEFAYTVAVFHALDGLKALTKLAPSECKGFLLSRDFRRNFDANSSKRVRYDPTT